MGSFSMDIMKLSDEIKLKGELVMELRNVKTGKVRRYVYKNMVVTFGKNAVAQRFSGDSDAGKITWCAVGTGTVAPALADTGLQTELTRKLISVRSYTNNAALFQTFYTTAEAIGTLREAGLFGDAVGRTASVIPGSGQLYCRVAINRTKTANDTLTLSWTVTVG
jgi:hypothetical protein